MCHFFLLAFLSLNASGGKFYKWVDDEGVLQYTAFAPGHRASEIINTQSGDSRPTEDQQAGEKPETRQTAARSKSKLEAPAEQDKSKTTPPTEQASAKTRDQNRENCAIGRKNLEVLSTRARARVKDADTGELRYLSPEEFAERKKQAENNIEKFCS